MLTSKSIENVKRYLFSDFISQFGSGLSFIALNWHILQKTGSTESVGLMITLDILGRFLVTPFAGIIVDQFNRKYILILLNLLRSCYILTILFLIIHFEFHLIYAYFLAFAGGVGLTVSMTASRAFIQEISDKEHLVQGQSYLETSQQLGMLVSGTIVGFIYNSFGIISILVIEVGAFLIGAAFLIPISNQNVFSSSAGKNLLQNYLRGYQYLKLHSRVWFFALIMILPYVVTIALNTVMPRYSLVELQSDIKTYGMLCVSYGVGGVLSGFLVNHTFKKYSHLLITHSFLLLSLFSLSVLFFNHSTTLALILFFGLGLANSSIKIVLQYTLMKNIANEYMGRVTSLINLISTVLQILGTYFSAMMIEHFPQIPCFTSLLLIMLLTYSLFISFTSKYRVLLTN